ncbi:MAG: hypothetical protein J5892_03235 [Bacilli bacterium]|nr:hypothetical protein [Bacilli bacterium]
MDCIITNKRRERIIENTIKIINDFKDMDEVEAIWIESYKGPTIIRNIIDEITTLSGGSGLTKTGNVLFIMLICNTDDPSEEFRRKFWDIGTAYEKFNICSKLGVDIKLNWRDNKNYVLLSDSDRDKTAKLYDMLYSNKVDYASALDYIKRVVVPKDYKFSDYHNYFNHILPSKIDNGKKSNVIHQALEYINNSYVSTRFLSAGHVVVDKTPDNFYKKVATQFDEYPAVKPSYESRTNRLMDLGINDQIVKKLSNNN